MRPTQPNKTGKATASDFAITPLYIAEKIIEHYKPQGICLDPCKGTGVFYNLLPSPKEWCEISKGKDFFNYCKKVDWIITNPPYSIYNEFLSHCFRVSNNVVFLCPIAKAFKSLSIENIVSVYGGLKEIWLIGSGTKCGFKFGFPTGCLYYKKGYTGKINYKR